MRQRGKETERQRQRDGQIERQRDLAEEGNLSREKQIYTKNRIEGPVQMELPTVDGSTYSHKINEKLSAQVVLHTCCSQNYLRFI